jgi:hypothetical protein
MRKCRYGADKPVKSRDNEELMLLLQERFDKVFTDREKNPPARPYTVNGEVDWFLPDDSGNMCVCLKVMCVCVLFGCFGLSF